MYSYSEVEKRAARSIKSRGPVAVSRKQPERAAENYRLLHELTDKDVHLETPNKRTQKQSFLPPLQHHILLIIL
jgi:hypothetical protein